MTFKHLFRPVNIGQVEIPNRMVDVSTDISTGHADGSVNQRVIAHPEEVARGGTGLILVGASTPDKDSGRSERGQYW